MRATSASAVWSRSCPCVSSSSIRFRSHKVHQAGRASQVATNQTPSVLLPRPTPPHPKRELQHEQQWAHVSCGQNGQTEQHRTGGVSDMRLTSESTPGERRQRQLLLHAAARRFAIAHPCPVLALLQIMEVVGRQVGCASQSQRVQRRITRSQIHSTQREQWG